MKHSISLALTIVLGVSLVGCGSKPVQTPAPAAPAKATAPAKTEEVVAEAKEKPAVTETKETAPETPTPPVAEKAVPKGPRASVFVKLMAQPVADALAASQQSLQSMAGLSGGGLGGGGGGEAKPTDEPKPAEPGT